MQNVRVSIIIPCKDEKENIQGLLKNISSQKISFDTEVIKITNIGPPGRARNKGAEQAKADILIFLDSDVRLGHEMVFKNIIEPLIADERIGICGTSQLIPRDANWFQQRCAKEIPHTEHPLVEDIKDVGMVGSAGCAIRRSVFFKVGKFNERLLRGVDVEFCYRMQKNNYRVVLVPQTWIYHPAPKNILQLVKFSFRNGKSTAFVDRYYPELNLDVGTERIIHTIGRKSIKYRLWRYIKDIIKSIITFRSINLISKIVYALGYFYGVIVLKNVQQIS